MERNALLERKTKSRSKVCPETKYRDCGASNESAEIVGDSKSRCLCKATEFVCSACLVCVCCPLAIAWCFVKFPCKLGWQALRRATDLACCGSEKRAIHAYSSFSDIDFDSLPKSCKIDKPKVSKGRG